MKGSITEVIKNTPEHEQISSIRGVAIY